MVLFADVIELRQAIPFVQSAVEGWQIHRGIFPAQTFAFAVGGVQIGFLHAALSFGGVFHGDGGQTSAGAAASGECGMVANQSVRLQVSALLSGAGSGG